MLCKACCSLQRESRIWLPNYFIVKGNSTFDFCIFCKVIEWQSIMTNRHQNNYTHFSNYCVNWVIILMIKCPGFKMYTYFDHKEFQIQCNTHTKTWKVKKHWFSITFYKFRVWNAWRRKKLSWKMDEYLSLWVQSNTWAKPKSDPTLCAVIKLASAIIVFIKSSSVVFDWNLILFFLQKTIHLVNFLRLLMNSTHQLMFIQQVKTWKLEILIFKWYFSYHSCKKVGSLLWRSASLKDYLFWWVERPR